MKQVVDFNEQLREEVIAIENFCEKLANKIEKQYRDHFLPLGSKLMIDLVRLKKGKMVCENELFSDDYESFIEIGIEKDEEYYPNVYIPIWKCKKDWFQLVGYKTKCNEYEMEEKLNRIIVEMIEEAE